MGGLIPAVLTNPYAAAVLLVLWQTAELYLGLKKPMDAGSVPQLLYRLVQRFQSWKIKGEGATEVMANNPNVRSMTLDVDGPTYDVLGVVVESITKLASGEKAQQVATEELGKALALMSELPLIQGDLAADRASVERAVALQGAALVDALFALRTAQAPATAPKPAVPTAAPTK